MEFNPDYKVIINTLTRIEAKAFIKFLELEIVGHQDDINQAKALIRYVEREIIR